MRKLRKVALVAAMVGSVSVLGAGVASAHGSEGSHEYKHDKAHEYKHDKAHEYKHDKAHDDDGDVYNTTVIDCDQSADTTNVTSQNGLINIAGSPITLLGSGNAESNSTQQICGIDNDENENESEAESGDAEGNVLTIVDDLI
ncbi:hypothetical protein ABZW18_10285 [Streptomyces sp. NPDC004647]|uniref:hypothetical protein n=1 Tax=Streptomyces sp. NPDC004647 TaxID=3154671 RepID=UPI0033AE4B05